MFAIASTKSLRIAVAAFSLSSVPAFADCSIPVDGVKNCMGTPNGAVPCRTVAASNIPAGTYMVSLSDRGMSNNTGNLSGTLRVERVIERADWSYKAAWGLAIGSEPVMVHFDAAPTRVDAFVVDNGCAQHTGCATLNFKGPL